MCWNVTIRCFLEPVMEAQSIAQCFIHCLACIKSWITFPASTKKKKSQHITKSLLNIYYRMPIRVTNTEIYRHGFCLRG